MDESQSALPILCFRTFVKSCLFICTQNTDITIYPKVRARLIIKQSDRAQEGDELNSDH